MRGSGGRWRRAEDFDVAVGCAAAGDAGVGSDQGDAKDFGQGDILSVIAGQVGMQPFDARHKGSTSCRSTGKARKLAAAASVSRSVIFLPRLSPSSAEMTAPSSTYGAYTICDLLSRSAMDSPASVFAASNSTMAEQSMTVNVEPGPRR